MALLLLFALSLVLLISSAPSGLHVDGNKIVDSSGTVHIFHGVDRSGTEFMCIQNNGIFDGPTNQTSIEAILSWNVDIVRVPLNEDCWLAINGAPAAYSGANYHSAIQDFVNLLNANGIVVILELHWSAPGSDKATGQQPMPDSTHSPDFWTGVAGAFRNNTSVILEIFNEPYPDIPDPNQPWPCWLQGGACPGFNYTVAGMQLLVDTIRGAGARNIILISPLTWSNNFGQQGEFLKYLPTDPLNNLAANWHSYNFNACDNIDCWEATVRPVLEAMPLLVTEIGENDCASQYITPLMTWLDSQSTGYLAWTWNTWDCNNGPSLISSYDGTPTNYGAGYKAHLEQFWKK